MGVFNGRDVYNPKIITAEITDAGNRKYFVPVKNMIGDYFVVDKINNQTYVFKLDGSRIKTTKQTGAFSFQTIDYDISHYLPISSDTKLIELTEKINSLPRINNKLLGILKILGRTEKDNFGMFSVKDENFNTLSEAKEYCKKNNIEESGIIHNVHNLTKLIEELSNSKDKYKQEVLEIMNYFARLNVTQIVTPLRRLTDFLEEDLKTTDPRYGGAIFDTAIEADNENRKMTNSPKTAKKSLFMLIAIPVILILVGTTVYFAYDAGAFDNLGSMFSGSFGGITDEMVKSQYPSCPSLKSAVNSGKLKYDTLSKGIQDVYNSCP
jgi:hypothetical protein